MLNMNNLYKIAVTSSNEKGQFVQSNDKYIALAGAIAITLMLDKNIDVSNMDTELFCERIKPTLLKWENELKSF